MGYRPVRHSRITQRFGHVPSGGGYASLDDSHGPGGHHTGIDFGDQHEPQFVPIDRQLVRSSTPGRVLWAEENSWAGKWVGIYFARDDVTISYWHLWNMLVHPGIWIPLGTPIGRVGNTGDSSDFHLHVQANPGRGFDYHRHVPPGPWVRGKKWARLGLKVETHSWWK